MKLSALPLIVAASLCSGSLVSPAYANESITQSQYVEIASASTDLTEEKIQEKITRLEKKIPIIEARIVRDRGKIEQYKRPAGAQYEAEYRPKAEKRIAELERRITKNTNKLARFRAKLAELKAML